MRQVLDNAEDAKKAGVDGGLACWAMSAKFIKVVSAKDSEDCGCAMVWGKWS